MNCPSIPVMRAQKHLIVILPYLWLPVEALEEIEDAIDRILTVLTVHASKPINQLIKSPSLYPLPFSMEGQNLFDNNRKDRDKSRNLATIADSTMGEDD